MKLSGLLFAAALLGSCTQPAAEENYTRHVDPKIGTGGHGHVFVGANVPFGLVQVGPTSIPQTWDWCSGYHASDSTVIGFRTRTFRARASATCSTLPSCPSWVK